jgi:hypothetical protein
MKITIHKYSNRIDLIKFLRSKENIELSKAVEIVKNLPYVFENLSKWDAQCLQREIENFAISTLEKEKEDQEYETSTCNFDPPQEYKEAVAWEETLSDQQKQYINVIVRWRASPVVS